MFIVEYYSNDSNAWERVYQREFYNLDSALENMRKSASEHRDLPHRVVSIETTTVALASQGEELFR